jgi:hypothetical protein
MKIYNYHKEYKYYISESEADESPLEPGVWLVPAYATEIEPPICNLGEVQIFNGESWEVVEDKRGVYYSINSSESFYNYNPLEIPENSTKDSPPEVPEGKLLKWDNGWVLEDLPPPPVLTPQEKLERAGLTVEELKQLLGINS